MQQFDRNIRLETETAVSMLNIIYKQQQESLLTEEQAKEFIISNGTSKFAVFKYMKKRAKFLLEKRAKNEKH